MFQDHRWAVAGATLMYLAAGLVFAVMALAPSWFEPVDDWWHDAVVATETALLTGVARFLDVVGGAIVIVPLRLAVGLYLGVQRRWAALVTLLVATALSEVAIGTFKALYGRARPLDPLVETSGAAFPSGHATAAAVTAVILVVVLIRPGEHRRAWEVRAGLFAFAMALSRTYLRAHWLTDVVAGALLGAATALATAAIVQVVRARLVPVPLPAATPDG